MKRFEISAYCHRCGGAEGPGAVVVNYDEAENGPWVRYFEYPKDRWRDVRKELPERQKNVQYSQVPCIVYRDQEI